MTHHITAFNLWKQEITRVCIPTISVILVDGY